MALSGVVSQWDVSQTAFNSADRLRSLISVVSRDNVQPQAILAAEALGWGLIVSPQRIGEAVEALGGNTSTRVESMKAFLGLDSGGVVREIRASTPLVRFFLLVTACKTCFTNTELGDLMFEMMKLFGILAKVPVSSSQLAQLINTFSGHSELIVPVNLMHEVAVAVDQYYEGDEGFTLYHRIDNLPLADLLFRIVLNFRDEAVTSITLLGHTSTIWLATILLWLFPEDTALLIGGRFVKGVQGGRLSLHLTFNSQNDWKVQIWKAADVTSCIIENDFSNVDHEMSFLPIQLAKSYYYQVNLGYGERSILDRELAITGGVAAIFINLMVEQGFLYDDKKCCKGGGKCAQSPIKNVLSSKRRSKYTKILGNYGWEDSIEDEHDKLILFLESSSGPGVPWHNSREDLESLMFRLKAGIMTALGHRRIEEEVLQNAMYIAADAISTATCDVNLKDRRISPMSHRSFEFAKDFISKVLSAVGLSVQSYRWHAFSQLLPGNEMLHAKDLVVSSQGYVVGYAALWKSSTKQSNVLLIRHFKGQIRKDGFQLSSIREAEVRDAGGNAIPSRIIQPEFLQLFEGDRYIGTERHQGLDENGNQWQDEVVRIVTHVSESGARLDMKHDAIRTIDGRESRARLSLLSSLDRIATARHIIENHALSVSRELELARSTRGICTRIKWEFPFNKAIYDERADLLLRTYGNELNRFFGAGLVDFSHQIGCVTYFIRGSGSILSCILIAEEEGSAEGRWRIFC